MIGDGESIQARRGGTDGRRHRMLLQWHVTERCNAACAHCYQNGAVREEPSIEQVEQVLSQFGDLLDDQSRENAGPVHGHINLTGGEPFIRDDIFDILDMIAGCGGRVSFGLLSNGTMIDDRAARFCRRKGARFVQVSLEGGRDTHDRIRGKGSFDRALRGLDHLRRQRVSTMIAFTAHRANVNEFPGVVRIGRRTGASLVWADRLIPMGAAESDALGVLSPAETRAFVEMLGREQRRLRRRPFERTRVAANRALQFLGGDGPVYHCTAGDTLLTILANGDLVPCRRMPVTVGNVYTTSMKTLCRGSEILRDLRDRRRAPVGCETCEHLPRCHGGLRCLAYAVHGDPHRADPGCWLARSPSAA